MQHNEFPRRHLLTLSLGAAAAALAGCSAAGGQATASTAASTTPPPTLKAQTTSAIRPTTTAPPAPTWVPGTPAAAISRGTGSRPQVALTFHGSGPVSITRQVMDILAAHQAHATVFAIGQWLAANPEVVRIVQDGGNEFGNHTWSHPQLSTYTPEPMYQEIARCRDELVKLTGSPGAFFRQSDGQYATDEERVQAGRAGYSRILNYDVDSTDWEGTSVATIRQAVATATPGSVISLHLGRQNTVAALPAVLADLSARGLYGVTGTELLR